MHAYEDATGEPSARVAVYRAPNSRAYGTYTCHVYAAAPPPENDDFEPTTAELTTAYANALSQRHGPNAPLMTSAMRAKRDAEVQQHKKKFDSVRIRVRFADRTQLEKVFPHSATILHVYELVDCALEAECGHDYVLFQSPPKRDYLRTDPALRTTTLGELGFAPGAVLGIRWPDASRNGAYDALLTTATDAPAPLLPHLLAKARDMPSAPSFSGAQIPSVRGSDEHTDTRVPSDKRKLPKVHTPHAHRSVRSSVLRAFTMAFSNFVYNVFAQRNSILYVFGIGDVDVGTILSGAFLFGIGFDTATQTWWDRHNYPKQWKDIRSKYIEDGNDDNDDE
ncbi:hypothetical protein MVES1_003431 [Malassezia vespertilionis]|uniref:uncharacterized protein n=1 Tax=Malassezia vespertilionis TaxID=2020962 RepID=UPI0024B220C5|nr:uncharacterized protein MVES1_003431 [Malassezia vespertilionis]WFD08062.1 hypothetical protein MVES1_003431 [Malassezia vespertilionis]